MIGKRIERTIYLVDLLKLKIVVESEMIAVDDKFHPFS
jgi:hypothetical protein